MDPRITTGIAKRRGHGVAMTMTDRNRSGLLKTIPAAVAIKMAKGV
jgi:hypothetical protein